MRILSSDGFKNFDGFIDQGISSSLYKVILSDGSIIKATGDHRFLMQGHEWLECEILMEGDVFSTGLSVVTIEQIENEKVYDAYNVEDVHNYYTNNVISHNCNLLYVDETAIIPNNVAEEFFTSVYPTISAGETTKIVLTSTPLGFNHFWKFWNDSVQGLNGFTHFEVKYHEHPKRDAAWAEEQRKLLGDIKFNQEVLCSFIGSSHSLIAGDVVARMSPIPYIFTTDDGLDIQKEPESNHQYVLMVDTSRGVGGDYSAFTIIDVSQVPYKVVGKYRNNRISPLLYPNVIHKVAKDYNDAYVLVEINDNGQQIADILYTELEYENIFSIGSNGKKGQYVSTGSKGDILGVRTTKQVKRIGCSNLKTLVESDKLLIFDKDIISELSTFIEKRGSYEADEGYHDDLVMTLVLFAWIVRDPYFKELTNVNLRQELFANRLKQIEEELTPFGVISTGMPQEKEPEIIAGDLWLSSEDDLGLHIKRRIDAGLG